MDLTRVPLYLVIMRGHYFVEVSIAGGSQLYWEHLFIVLLKLKFIVSFCLLLFLSVCVVSIVGYCFEWVMWLF